MIFPEQAEYATFANEMLKNQARKPDYKVAEVILITMVAKNHESFLPSKSELCFNIISPVLEKGIFKIHKNDVHKIFKNNNCSCAFGRVC